jgi:hypothetical protein
MLDNLDEPESQAAHRCTMQGNSSGPPPRNAHDNILSRTKIHFSAFSLFVSMERLEHEYVVVQTDETRSERLATYATIQTPRKCIIILILHLLRRFLEELVDGLVVVKRSQKLVFCRVPDAHGFLQFAFKHDLLYRVVHRYYRVQWRSATLDWTFLGSPGASLEDNSESYRLLVFPKDEERSVIDSAPVGINLQPKTFSHLLCIIHAEASEWYFGSMESQFLYSPGILSLHIHRYCVFTVSHCICH